MLWSHSCECSLCLVEDRIREQGLLVMMDSWRALLPAHPCCRVTSTPMGTLSKTCVTAARQGICSGKLNSMVYIGKMEGIPEKKWHHTVPVLWIASRQQDRPVRAHSSLHSRGNWGSTAASEVRVTPQRLC